MKKIALLALLVILMGLLPLRGILAAVCNDGIDNDSDGLTDYPADPDCTSASDTAEIKPMLIGAYDTPGSAIGVYIYNNYAYVTDDTSGLQIINLTNLSAPSLAGAYDTPGNSRGVYVSGNYAYVADGSPGLKVFNITNPAVPSQVGQYNTPGSTDGCQRVKVISNLSYIADGGSGLQILNISTPTAPAFVGSWNGTGTARDIFISGNYAYLAHDVSGLRIINISTPSAPTLSGTYDTPGSAYGVYVVGNYAYVADYGSGLQIINISNPSSPSLVGTYDTPGNAEKVYVINSLAYVADEATGIQIINISNPSAPKFAASYDTPGSAYDLFIFNNVAYVADYGKGLQIISTGDRDGDGISDWWELNYACMQVNTSDATQDYDSDSLNNLGEFYNRTNPCIADTDGDGMPDGWEVSHSLCLNPLVNDSSLDPDNDGLSNLQEYQAGTDPCKHNNALECDRFVNKTYGSDTTGNGSSMNPWATIQYAVDHAADGDTVCVSAGVYPEGVTIGAISITLKGGYDPLTWARNIPVFRTIIQRIAVNEIGGVEPIEVIDGFMITNPSGDGIVSDFRGLTGYPSIYIVNNIIFGNQTGIKMITDHYPSTAGQIYVELAHNLIINNNIGIDIENMAFLDIMSNFCNPYCLTLTNYVSLTNNTIYGNLSKGFSGLYDDDDDYCAPMICHYAPPSCEPNCFDPDPFNCFDCYAPFEAAINSTIIVNNSYECLFDCSTQNSFIGTMDPKFWNPGKIDHTIMPDSPCINAGDPNPSYNDPDGTRNDIGFTGGQSPFFDRDYDGMPDSWEIYYGLDPNDPADGPLDFDSDGVINRVEYFNGTNPFNSDTDGDGLPDAWEITYSACVNPLIGDSLADPDNDTVNNKTEKLRNTNPCAADTDGDGLRDDWEIAHIACMNPLVGDSLLDPDNDGLNNKNEKLVGTDPCNPDSDSDGMSDGWEFTYMSCGLDPTHADGSGDPDNDGATNLQEYQSGNGINPCNPDTDADGLNDGLEINTYHTDPNNTDTDRDGVSDGDEVSHSMNPLWWDSDYDMLPDGFEFFTLGFNPTSYSDGGADWDSDKITNAHEFWNRSPINAWNPNGYGATGSNKSFWGDSGVGDGLVGPDDLAVLAALMGGDHSNMATVKFYGVIPTTGHTLDMDSDGDWTPADYSILSAMLNGQNTMSAGGMPESLVITSSPGYSIMGGETTHIAVKVRAQAQGKYTTGVAVVFTIDTVNSTGMASLWGGDGPASDHPDYGKYRWDQTGALLSNGYNEVPARIMVLAEAQGTVVIRIHTPEVGTSGHGRYMPYLETAPFTVMVREWYFPDTDGDGLSDIHEINTYFTNPHNPDTDGDGMNDGWEVNYKTCMNPTASDGAADPDNDSLTNLQEYQHGTNPCAADTDGDGLPDGWEIAHIACMNPLVGDSLLDPDGDGVNNRNEKLAGTDPCNSDTDGDGMQDSWEITYMACVNPLVGDSLADPDSDTINNKTEKQQGTNPCAADTDGDGLRDDWEIAHIACVNPLVGDSLLDPDGDGLNNKNEKLAGTDPCNSDTDGGGEGDSSEVAGGRNPLDPLDDVRIANIGSGTGIWAYPLGSSYHDARTQVIYLASEIGMADSILSLAMDVATIPGQTLNNFTIRMKHTTLSAYPASPDWEASGWTVVYQNNVKINDTGWITFNFTSPFSYNHSDNLLIDFSFNDNYYSTDGFCRYSKPGGRRSIFYQTDSEYGDPLTWSGTTDPIPSGGTNVPNIRIKVVPFLDSDGDGLSNSQEINIYHTDPYNPDTDGDGLSDGEEVAAGLNPSSWDSDHDGLPDKFELDNIQFDPLNATDGPADLDGDKISNANEYWNRSRIAMPDPGGFGATGDNRSYWGDSGAGDGVVGPEDISVMRALVAGDFSYMATLKFYNVIPTSGQTMDLDPEGLFTATDLSILRDMIAGRNCNYVGSMPSALELDLSSPPAATVQVGYTTHIGVKVKAQATGKYMTGASVVFKVDTVLSKGQASLFGGDGPAMNHPDYGKYRWDQVGQLNSSATDETPSRIMIRVDAAGTIIINVFTPEVGVSGQGRYIPALTLPDVQIKGMP